MGDAENPSSKKRAAGREISRDNPGLDDDDASEEETGTFKRASDEVLATRRIVKVRRSQPASTASQPASTPSSNPFAAICLVPPTETSATVASSAAQSHSAADKAVSEVDTTALDDNTDDKGVEGAATGEPNCTDGGDKQLKNETNGSFDKEEKTSVEDATKLEEGDKKAELGDESKGEDEEGDKKEEPGEEAKDEFREADKTVESGEEADKTVVSREETKGEVEVGDNKSISEEETKDAVKDGENDNRNATGAPPSVSSFQQLSSSQNAFTGLAGTGFGSSSFSFGSIARDGSNPSFPSFGGFSNANNGSSSLQLFGATASEGTKKEGSGLLSMQEVPIETGEENEKAVFSSDAVLFEYIDGGWKERGKGELKVNVSTSSPKKARLVMRARGNYRLILNANLYPDMKLANMDKRGITFACMNSASEGKEGLTTCALKFRDASIVDEFRGVVMAQKGEKVMSDLKTPENSPKASDD